MPLVCCHINFEHDDTQCDFRLPNFETSSMSPLRLCYCFCACYWKVSISIRCSWLKLYRAKGWKRQQIQVKSRAFEPWALNLARGKPQSSFPNWDCQWFQLAGFILYSSEVMAMLLLVEWILVVNAPSRPLAESHIPRCLLAGFTPCFCKAMAMWLRVGRTTLDSATFQP